MKNVLLTYLFTLLNDLIKYFRKNITHYGLFFIVMFLSSMHAYAQSSEWTSTPLYPEIKMKLRSNSLEHNHVELLLDLQLGQHWKTYWRSPGNGVESLQFKWDNATVSPHIYWPVPTRFLVAGIYTQGYKNSVSIAMKLEGELPPLLVGTLTIPVCSDICTLIRYPISLSTTTKNYDGVFEVDYFNALNKASANEGVFTSLVSTIENNSLIITAQAVHTWQQPQLFIDNTQTLQFGLPDVHYQDKQLIAKIPIIAGASSQLPANLPIDIVISDDNHAQQGHYFVNTVQDTSSSFSFAIIGYALLGGFILNLMPCVFPVLGMKLAHFLTLQQKEKKVLRQQFLLSSLGIISSFWLLAGVITLLKLGGITLGWGVQFQHPLFLFVMAFIMFVFTLNLLDAFYLYLPPSISNFLANKGSNSSWGSYLQGMFATLLATPCSAPFLGTAITIAFLSSLPVLWIIFTFMGIGMSLPWFLVALFPQIARFMPKSGIWMSRIKFLLGILMLFSTLWLLSLLIAHINGYWVATLIILTIIIALYSVYKRYTKGYLILMLGCLMLFGSGYAYHAYTTNNRDKNDGIHWQPFSEHAISQALNEGKTVFVNVTASWCITCKVNELNVFSLKEVQTQLNRNDVVALKADWTTQDAVVTAFLHSQNQYSIPFYQVYTPDQPQGKTLATLLKKWDIINLLSHQQEQHNND